MIQLPTTPYLLQLDFTLTGEGSGISDFLPTVPSPLFRYVLKPTMISKGGYSSS